MSLNFVTLTLDLYDGQRNPITRGVAFLTPTAQLTDTVNGGITTLAPVPGVFHSGGFPQVKLEATDNSGPEPAFAWTITFDGVPGSPASFSFFLPYTGGATQNLSDLAPVSAPSALVGTTVGGVSVAPSGDTSGATDQVNITGAEAAGRTVYLGPGTFYVTGLTKQSGTIWQGAGRLETVIMLAAGADTDVVQGAGFSTLTLSGSTTGGIGGWGIRDLTIDGNKAHQTGTSHGLRVYGYNFDLSNVSIRNTLSTCLYTEWGNFGGNSVTDGSMEARLYGVKLHGGSSHGWHNRGPHDSRAWDLTIFGNATSGYGYWPEAMSNVTYTVASGSNGVNVATFAGSGTLNVSTTAGWPTASISATQGSITVATSAGTAVITYTGVTAQTFTGCTTTSGSGTLSTGGILTPTGGGYSANGCLLFGAHVYGTPTWDYLLDAQTHLVDCIGEVAQAGGGTVLFRASGSMITGGYYFIVSGASQTGCGLQVGDTVNPAGSIRAETLLDGFTGADAAHAAVSIVNDGGGCSIDALAYQASGTTLFGTPQTSSRVRIATSGQTAALNAGNGTDQTMGQVTRYLPTVSQGWRLSKAGAGDLVNLNVSGNRAEHVGGLLSRWYTDAYTTAALDIDGSKGHILPRSGVTGSLNPAPSNGTYATGTPTVNSGSSDTAGTVTATLTASPGVGSIVTVTFKNAFGNHPVIIITPANAITAQIQAYVTPFTSAFTISAAVAPPAGADSATVAWNWVVLGQDS